MCDMTHSNVWHDSFICVTRPIHMCDMTHTYTWHAAFICVTCLVNMCDMPHSYACHTYERNVSHIWKRRVTHMNESRVTYLRHATRKKDVMLHKRCHVAHRKSSRHAYEWVMSHMSMRHTSRMHVPCHTYKVVTSRIPMRHVTRRWSSRHAFQYVVSHIRIHMCAYIWTYEWEPSHTHIWGTPHKYKNVCTNKDVAQKVWHLVAMKMSLCDTATSTNKDVAVHPALCALCLTIKTLGTATSRWTTLCVHMYSRSTHVICRWDVYT